MKIRFTVTVLFFLLLFLHFTDQITVITDFWWHLATGRWIAENGSLPSADPFLYTSNQNPSLRVQLLLKGYWLAQLMFYWIHRFAGFYGIVVIKALLFAAMHYAVWRSLVKKGYEQITALAFLIPLVFLGEAFNNPRPQLFSFLAIVITVRLLENLWESICSGTVPCQKRIFLLPIIMILWANLHPGFIMGSVVILLYAGRVVIFSAMNRAWQPAVKPVLLLAASFASAGLNPCGYDVALAMLKEKNMGAARFADSINEYYPAFKYYLSSGQTWLALLLGSYVLLMLFLFFRGWNRDRLFHTFLFLSFLGVGLMSFRYMIFFNLVAPLLLPKKISTEGQRTNLSWVLVACMTLFLAYSLTSISFFTGVPVSDREARGMTEFMKSRPDSAVIFNPYEWGGYMEWNLYPRYRLFIDARTLEIEPYDDYMKAVQGKKQEVFAKYGIDHVCFYLSAPTAKMMPSLLYSLLRDSAWSLGYVDGYAAVFMKTAAADSSVMQKKSGFIDARIAAHSRHLAVNPSDVVSCRELGQLHYVKGDNGAAIRFFRRALEIDPKDDFSLRWLKLLGG